jgi:hypothetical protein
VLVDDIGAALVAANIGHTTATAADWRIYFGYLQDPPDRAICIYETGGEMPETNWLIDRPSFQIRVRGNPDDYQAVRTKIQDVFNLLHAGEVAVGTDYVFIYAVQSGPIPLGQDEKRRPHLVQNYKVMKKRT